jgi:DNA-binding MarR family transcriptional regulator
MDVTRRGTHGETEFAVAIWSMLRQQACSQARDQFALEVGRAELSHSQARVLLELDQPLSQRQLARQLRYDPSNITALADALEARGLIERRPDPSDRRFRLVALTPAGERLRSDLGARLAQPVDGLARLSVKDQQELLRLLRLAFGDTPDAAPADRVVRPST